MKVFEDMKCRGGTWSVGSRREPAYAQKLSVVCFCSLASAESEIENMDTVIVHNDKAIFGHGIWAATSLADGMTQLHVQAQLFQCYTLEILAIPFLSPV